VRQISADRAAIADRSMSNMSVRRNDQRCMLPHGRGRQHVSMPRESTNHKPVTIDPDPIEPRDTIDVDEPLRCDNPKIHHRNKALAAGEDLCRAAILG
jgi:hypothetical protein